MRIAFVLVNYKTMADSLKYLENFKDVETNSAVLVFHDNDESPGNEERYQQIKSAATEICPNLVIEKSGCSKNLGYIGAFAYVIDGMLNRKQFDFIFLSNPDIEFDCISLLEKLSTLPLLRNPVIATKIISKLTWKNQNPYMVHKPPKYKIIFFSWLFRSRMLAGTYRILIATIRKFLRNKPSFEGTEIYAGHGSFIGFTRIFFEKKISLSMRNFLFCEEFFIGHQLEKLDLAVTYIPEISVIHREHASTRLFPTSKICKHLQQAHQTALKDYY